MPEESQNSHRARLSQVQQTAVRELLRVSPVLEALGTRFRTAGEEIALVGGPVRDALLGRLHNDLDLTTSARPEVTERLLTGWADAIWDMGRDFGTIGCRKDGWQIEITTYRSDEYDPSSRKPEVAYGDSLDRRPGPPRLHRQRDGGDRARAGVRGPVRRAGRPGRQGAAHPRTPGGLLRRRPAADDAGCPVRGAARVHRRPGVRGGDDRHGRAHRHRLRRTHPRRAREARHARRTPASG